MSRCRCAQCPAGGIILSLLEGEIGPDAAHRARFLLAEARSAVLLVLVRVIDGQGQELPVGAFGELVGRSGFMMQGYHNLPEQTQALLWTDRDGNQFIRSGDIGRIDEDGFVHLMDRKKDMIISDGFNIFAADLEAALLQHPDVAEAAVIAIPSEAWGETPLGFVVPRAGVTPDAQEILAFANASLGKTQRLSRTHLRADLPRSEIGKAL